MKGNVSLKIDQVEILLTFMRFLLANIISPSKKILSNKQIFEACSALFEVFWQNMRLLKKEGDKNSKRIGGKNADVDDEKDEVDNADYGRDGDVLDGG